MLAASTPGTWRMRSWSSSVARRAGPALQESARRRARRARTSGRPARRSPDPPATGSDSVRTIRPATPVSSTARARSRRRPARCCIRWRADTPRPPSLIVSVTSSRVVRAAPAPRPKMTPASERQPEGERERPSSRMPTTACRGQVVGDPRRRAIAARAAREQQSPSTPPERRRAAAPSVRTCRMMRGRPAPSAVRMATSRRSRGGGPASSSRRWRRR